MEILYFFEKTLISKLLDILRNNYYNHFKDKYLLQKNFKDK